MTVTATMRQLATIAGLTLFASFCAAAPIMANCDPFTSAGRDINITQRLRANETMSITFSTGNNFTHPECRRNACALRGDDYKCIHWRDSSDAVNYERKKGN